MHEEITSPGQQFLHIMFQPDNIPIIGMMFLVFWFTYLGFREARKNDQMIDEGRREDVLREMQK